MKPQRNPEEIFKSMKLFEKYEKQDVTTISAAAVFTLIFHLLAILILPSAFDSFVVDQKKPFEELNIEILEPVIEQKKPLPEFIEANRLANNEKPDRAAKESFQDQRAKDEVTDKNSNSPLPYVEGESKESQKIVQGNAEQDRVVPSQQAEDVMKVLERPLEQPAQSALEKPQDSANSKSENQSDTKSEMAKEVSGTEADKSTSVVVGEKMLEDNNKSQSDSDLTQAPEPSKNGEEITLNADKISHIAQSKKSESIHKELSDINQTKKVEEHKPVVDVAPAAASSMPAPKPRPVLDMRGYSGPLLDNNVRANEHGTMAVDSKFSEFGAYFQRMIEAIARQWYLLCSRYDLTSAMNSRVIVTFYINSEGELTRIQTMYTSSPKMQTSICEQAILSTAPYGIWTEDMVKTFSGQDQSVTITFYYR